MQRNAYVYGLIDGYMMGFYRACDLADQLFEKGKPHHLGDGHHPSDLPSSRCLVHRGEFTKKGFDKQGQPDVSAYTDVITAFYTDHSSCREFPFGFLLQSLGAQYASADQLYDMAMKGQLEHYPRSRSWCSGGGAQSP